MARYVSNATGNWSTAGTWDTVVNTPTIHATTNITVNTTGVNSATFTAPNLVNASTGCVIYLVTKGSAATITATLQEDAGAGFADTTATATVTLSNLATPTTGTWVNFKWGTAYVYTTTTANKYRIQLKVNTSTLTVGADSGGANFAYLTTDDVNASPAATDDVWVVGNNGANTVTVTMDGTVSFGSGTDTASVATTNRSIGFALNVGDRGVAIADTAADVTYTCLGRVMVSDGGEFDLGTVATPMPAARTCRWRFNENGTTVNYGLSTIGTGKCILQGAAKSSTSLWKTTYVSGVGTVADPFLVTDAVNWSVGDEILVAAYSANATNYNETESRYIITVNSATSYVLSTSKGGAAAALTFTHTAGAYVLNVERNVWIDTTNTSHACWIGSTSSIEGNINYAWVRFETIGNGTTGAKFGVQFNMAGSATNIAIANYCVAYRPIYAGFCWAAYKAAMSVTSAITFTGLIVCYQNSASTGAPAFNVGDTTERITLVDCFSMGNNRVGFRSVSGTSLVFTRCIAVANGFASGSTTNGPWILSTVINTLFLSCESHCNNISGVQIANVIDSVFQNFLCGSKGINQTTDVLCSGVATYNTTVFDNGLFGSATTISGYTGNLSGSVIGFQKFNQVLNNHLWYTKYGVGRSTGAGLADTTIYTTGSLGVRIAPEDNTIGLIWKFRIVAKASSIVSFLGYFQKNTAMGTSTCKVDLFLPGTDPDTGTPDDTQTLSNTTGTWQAVVLSANYTGTVDLLATIKVTAISATAAAYLYADTFYNAPTTNKIAGLDTWYQGQPVSLIVDTTFDPSSVWSFDTTNLTVLNTTGNQVKKLLTTPKFLALK